jgi:hypothetical protein
VAGHLKPGQHKQHPSRSIQGHGGRGVSVDQFARAVDDGDEDKGVAFAGRGRQGFVGSSSLTHAVGHDRRLMRVFLRFHGPLQRMQAVLQHDPPHPGRRPENAVCSQSGPDLAIAFPVEQ